MPLFTAVRPRTDSSLWKLYTGHSNTEDENIVWTCWALTDLIPNLMSYHREAVWWLCSMQNVLIQMKVFLGLTWFTLFLLPAKLLEEAVEEAVAEAEVVGEEEEAQDDNFPSCNSYQILGNFGYFLYRSCLWYPFLINWNVKRCLSFVSKAWGGRQVCPVSRAVADYTDLVGCHCRGFAHSWGLYHSSCFLPRNERLVLCFSSVWN